MKQQLPSHFMNLGRCGGEGKQKIPRFGVGASKAFSVGPLGPATASNSSRSSVTCPSGVSPPVHRSDAPAWWDVCAVAVEPVCDVLVYSCLMLIVYSSFIFLLRMRVLAGLTIISFRSAFALLAFISSSRRHFSWFCGRKKDKGNSK